MTGLRTDLHIPATFHSFQHGDFVGVFDVATDRDAHSDAGNFHSRALELLRKVHGSSLAFDRGIGRKDDLVDIALFHAGNQIADAQLLRADSVQRRDRPVENMEDSVEVLGLLDGRDIGGFFDHAHQSLVTRGTSAVDAGIDVSDVIADGAEAEIGLDIAHRNRQGFGVFIARAQNVESETLGALGADAGELLQFIDQARHGFSELGHFGIS